MSPITQVAISHFQRSRTKVQVSLLTQQLLMAQTDLVLDWKSQLRRERTQPLAPLTETKVLGSG